MPNCRSSNIPIQAKNEWLYVLLRTIESYNKTNKNLRVYKVLFVYNNFSSPQFPIGFGPSILLRQPVLVETFLWKQRLLALKQMWS